MLSTYAHVLCEVVLVFACMFYHADYYIIIVIAYDYKCSHASFRVYVRMGSEPGHPLPMNHNERKKWRKWENKTSEIIGLHATEVQKIKK